jgi:hypothetical protein
VEEWQEIDVDNLQFEGNHAYDSSDSETREPVDLRTLPVVDEYGLEINIYDHNRFRIPRRTPLHDPDQKPCGLLADLTRVCAIFPSGVSVDGDDSDDEVAALLQPPCVMNVYPQAFTHCYGHFQSNDMPTPFRPLIKTMNQQLAHDTDDANPIIRAVACQGYNHIQHSLTERAGGLELVHGRMTSSIAGTLATSTRTKWVHRKLFTDVSAHLPFERVEEKLNRNEAVSTAYRIEPIVVLNIWALQPRYRNGR